MDFQIQPALMRTALCEDRVEAEFLLHCREGGPYSKQLSLYLYNIQYKDSDSTPLRQSLQYEYVFTTEIKHCLSSEDR